MVYLILHMFLTKLLPTLIKTINELIQQTINYLTDPMDHLLAGLINLNHKHLLVNHLKAISQQLEKYQSKHQYIAYEFNY